MRVEISSQGLGQCRAAVLHDRHIRNQNILKLALIRSTMAGNEIKGAGKKVLENKGTNHIFGLKLGRHSPLLPPAQLGGRSRSIVTSV